MPWNTLNGLPSTSTSVPSTTPAPNCTRGAFNGAAAFAADGSTHERDIASVAITARNTAVWNDGFIVLPLCDRTRGLKHPSSDGGQMILPSNFEIVFFV